MAIAMQLYDICLYKWQFNVKLVMMKFVVISNSLELCFIGIKYRPWDYNDLDIMDTSKGLVMQKIFWKSIRCYCLTSNFHKIYNELVINVKQIWEFGSILQVHHTQTIQHCACCKTLYNPVYGFLLSLAKRTVVNQ